MVYYINSVKYKRIADSEITSKMIPLYDIIKNKIVLVNKKDIKAHIEKNHFRPICKSLVNKNTRNIQYLKQSNHKKTLQLVKKISYTICKKPSFLYYVKGTKEPEAPYYTNGEMVNLALNNRLIKDKNIKMDKLCKILQENQFQKSNILKHTNYIQKSKGMYMIRYYTFVGDAAMNSYLRNLGKDEYQNNALVNNIFMMWKLIQNAPTFSKIFSVYRRIGFDYLKHLKVGDKYVTDSFMSTTRDPLYEPDGFTFGNIVIKVNMPINKKGVGLMLELFSHFPEELEVLIPPNVEMKLKRINWKYYHHNKQNERDIEKTYEFDIIRSKGINIPQDRLELDKQPQYIHFNKLVVLKQKTLGKKIKHFLKEYANNNMQFTTEIGVKKYLFNLYFYDSTSVYKKLYKYKTEKGVSLVYQNQKTGQICLFIEIGKDIHINYHLNYYDIDNCPKFTGLDIISERSSYDLLKFYKYLADTFKIKNVYIYPNMVSCIKFYNRCTDKTLYNEYVYRSITYDKDLYDIIHVLNKSTKHTKRFLPDDHLYSSYEKIEIMFEKEIPNIFKNMKLYKEFRKKYKSKETIGNLWLYTVEYKCTKLRTLENILEYYYKKKLFTNYYIFNPSKFEINN